jgi:hypothetical protein
LTSLQLLSSWRTLPRITGNDGLVISTTARPFRIPISAYSRPEGET